MQTNKSIPLKLSRLGSTLTAASLLLLLPVSSVLAATWYVAPTGSDSNAGSQAAPFLTIMKAQSSASSGDTVYLRGGTYFLNNSNLTATNSPWVIVNNITKNGISYLAYPGEDPIFNFTNVKPSGYRVTAFLVNASECYFKGFEVVGVQVTIPLVHTQSECFRIIGGNHNTFEQLSMHDGMANGWYLTGGSSNLVLNCDAYNNAGLDGGSIGNTDGFGCHPSDYSGTGNVFRGCRAWFNSDDGYDCINAYASVTWDHCWSAYNGLYTNFTATGGDANGFKGGGYGANGTAIPNPLPRHLIQYCVAVGNNAAGFYANHGIGGENWFNNTAYRNTVNYNMLGTETNNVTDVPGYGNDMKNNLGFMGHTEVENLDYTNSDVSYNYFTLPVTVTSNDFVSLDESQMIGPRQANGEVPIMTFLHLASGSHLIDAGTVIPATVNITPPLTLPFGTDYPYNGAAPDLGRFEYGLVEVPNYGFEVPLISTNVYNPSGGFWTFSGGPGSGSGISVNGDTLTSANTNAPEGVRVAFLESTGTIVQTVSGFTPGAAYTVTYSAAQRNGVGQVGETWNLTVGNTVIASYAPPPSATNYIHYTANFIASGPNLNLGFVGTDLNGGDNTVFLDRVGIGQISALGLLWQGDGVANNWDSTSSNWFNGVTTVPYQDGDNVAFDDTGSNTPPINLIGTLSPASVIVNASNSYTFGGSGSLAGTGTVGKAGTGMLTINTTNSYSGSTIVGGGTLLVNGSIGQSPVTVWSNAVIAGNGLLGGGLTVQAGSSVMPGNGNNVAGTLTVSNGLIEAGGVINFFDLSNNPNGANDLINVDNLNLSGTNTIQINPLNGSLALGAYSLISYSGNLGGGLSNLTLSGSPSSPLRYGSLTNASGVIALLVGSTRPPASLVWYGDDASYNWDTGGTTDWWNGGFLDYFFAGDSVTFTNTTATNVNLVGVLTPGAVVVNATVNYSFGGSGSIGGSGGLTMTGSGTLVILTTNGYTGATTVLGGTLLVNGSLNQSPVTVAGGATIGGNGLLGGGLTAQAGSSVIVGNGSNVVGTLTVSNGMSEAGGVVNYFGLSSNPNGSNDVINVVGNLNLSGTNTIQMTLLNGMLGAGVYPLINYTGVLIGGPGNLTLSGGYGILTNPPGQIALSSNGRPPANLDWNGGGAAGTNWDTGVSTNWLNAGAPDLFFTGDSVTFTNTTATNVVFVGSLQPAAVLVNATVNYNFVGGGTLSGSTGLTKTNSGSLTILTTNVYTGATVIEGGTLSVAMLATGGVASAIGASSSATNNLVLDGGTLLYTGPSVATDRGATVNPGGGTLAIATSSTILTQSTTWVGSGALSKIGSGGLTLSASNAFGGGLTVNAGTVTLASLNAAGTGTLTFNGGAVVLNGVGGPAVYANAVNVAVTGTLYTPSGNNNQALSGAWSGSGTLSNNTISGGTTSVQGNMSGFSGTILLTGGGTFRFYNTSTGSGAATFNLGTSNAVVQTRDGGSMNLGALIGGGGTIVRGAGSSANPTTYFIGGNNASTTYSGTITNGTSSSGPTPTSITKVGSGTLILTGTNSFTGTTTISNGTLQIGSGSTSGALGATSNVVNLATLSFNRSNTITNGVGISGSGTLFQLGTGTLILTGTNTYAGLTTISNGTLQVGNGGTTGTIGSNNVQSSATLAFNRSDAITCSNLISGSGNLLQVGGGTLSLTRSSTYTGGTTVSAGTLLVNNTSGSGTGSGSVTVNGGTLSGTGVIAGSVTVNSGGALSPGNPLGTLTISNNLSVNSGAVLAYELGTNSALTVVSSNLTLGGTLNVSNAGGFGAGTYELFGYGKILTYNGVSLGSAPVGYNYAINTNTSGQVSLVVTVPLSAFQQWQMNYFGCTNCAQAAPDADPLGKGISNTNQFLLGLNPTNPASVFRILSAVQQTTNVVITWAAGAGRTNVVQATGGDANGGYTNNFSDISGLIILSGSGDVTNSYTDVGGATNIPSRYYRIRLGP